MKVQSEGLVASLSPLAVRFYSVHHSTRPSRKRYGGRYERSSPFASRSLTAETSASRCRRSRTTPATLRMPSAISSRYSRFYEASALTAPFYWRSRSGGEEGRCVGGACICGAESCRLGRVNLAMKRML